MEDQPFNKRSLLPSLPRDARGSLEVFNPSTFSARPQRSHLYTWRSRPTGGTHQPPPEESVDEEITPQWLALPRSDQVKQQQQSSTKEKNSSAAEVAEDAAAAERAAEWGLVLRRDSETGRPQGVEVRRSGEKRASGGGNTSASCRSSGEESSISSAAGAAGSGMPRISEDLREVLSAFQQTFVVSDATKPDHPIMYASAGFFNMTGYLPKEVIGRNCRFLQGAETDQDEIAKIREALNTGTSYCGRILNYKKDATPFWNLLTIAPIKDDSGKVLKYIGMQVEVSKYTEGSKLTMLRPNGLPESLICYDARQKENARSSLSQLVTAVKNPRTLLESSNSAFRRKSDCKTDGGRSETPGRRNSASASPLRQSSGDGMRKSMQKISEVPEGGKKRRILSICSFLGLLGLCHANVEKHEQEVSVNADKSMESDDERPESLDDQERKKEMRRGIDLATTLERIEKNFVITDPRLPDNPIIFASDSFLELTEYSREEILGRNCRFLQGPETDRATVIKIREAIDNQRDVTVQLLNYTKSGQKFWNIFHLQPMRDQKGEVQYFIGVQLDGSEHVEPLQNCIPETAAKEGAKLVKETAENVDEAVRELPDANLKPEDLWANHSNVVLPKPHMKNNPAWKAIQKVLDTGEKISLKHFRPVKALGSGDTGSVHLVELLETGEYFALKAMDKTVMLNRNKVHRACAEREILDMLDHPFLPTLYASFQTKTHICLITDYCPGGELFLLLDKQPLKVLKEDAVRFYTAEIVVVLEYLHCQGIIYRDLKPENILIRGSGHISLTDFDLSCLTSCKPQDITQMALSQVHEHMVSELSRQIKKLLLPDIQEKKKQSKERLAPLFIAEPMRASNSFVGTEEYIAPEIITGAGHTSAVDWWALGILLYEMFYGYTPFRGKTRQKTFANILHKEIKFPSSNLVSFKAKQLMYQLIHRDPKNRLGSYEGANEIKQHPFFSGINWALVRCMSPPKLDIPILKSHTGREADINPGHCPVDVF